MKTRPMDRQPPSVVMFAVREGRLLSYVGRSRWWTFWLVEFKGGQPCIVQVTHLRDVYENEPR